jgi:CBS-domain-containing membrane protein
MMRGALGGLRVGDVMSRDPAVAPGWITVDEFMRTYASAQHANAYPLKTFDGAVDGIVTLARLARVPQEERRVRRVRDFGIGMDRVATARPGEPLSGVLDRFSASGDGQMLVMDDGKLVGSLSASDIIRALGGAARSSS